MGSKYKTVIDNNPAPGQYDVDTGMGQTKERKYEAMIVPYDD